MNIGELFVSLGFDVDDTKLKDFNNKIIAGRNELLEMSAVAAGAVYSLNAFLEGSVQNAVALRNFTNETGFSSEALQKWQLLVRMTNPAIGAEEALNSYKKLTDYLTQASLGHGAGALNMLGVNYFNGMTPDQAIAEIRKALPGAYKNFTQAQVSGFLAEIFGNAGVLNALKATDAEADRLTAGKLRTQQDLAAQAAIGDKLRDISVQWDNFRSKITAEWAGPLIAGIQHADDAFGDFIENLKAIIHWIEEMKALFVPVAAVLTPVLAAWAIATFPVTSAFAALAFAINDVGRAIRGLPTITGGFLETEWKGLKTLFTDPVKFGNNFLSTIDNLAGLDNNDPSLHWLPSRGLPQLQGVAGRGTTQNITSNVTQHITSSADPKSVADEVTKNWRQIQQNELNGIYIQLDQGANY